VTIFLVTVDILGSRAITKVEAAHVFTSDQWVTFWSSDRLNLPDPVARFRREDVEGIIEKSDHETVEQRKNERALRVLDELRDQRCS
jgi:hypothetical protein